MKELAPFRSVRSSRYAQYYLWLTSNTERNWIYKEGLIRDIENDADVTISAGREAPIFSTAPSFVAGKEPLHYCIYFGG